MKTFNKLFVLWCVVATMGFAGLCTIGFMFKNNIKKYHEYESVLVDATKAYVLNEGAIDFDANYIDISISTLEKKGYLKKSDMLKSCTGKVRIENNKQIKYTPLIKCNNYKSK